ncbi:MAG: heparinase II/III family protein, partial [Rhodospirillales bacterium]|nr:heparinase II/III family protein [Rhodospirillales bacterium]
MFSSRIYPLTLRWPPAKAPRSSPPDLWPGDLSVGLRIAKGEFQLGAQKIALKSFGAVPAEISTSRLAYLHGFSWLRDLRAFGSDRAPVYARGLIESWLDNHSDWDLLAWRPDVLASRLCSWLTHFDFIDSATDSKFHGRFVAALTGQSRHLRRVKTSGFLDGIVFRLLKARILGAVFLFGDAALLQRDIGALKDELARQLWPDGGQAERSPLVLAGVLGDLLEIRSALSAARLEIPESLQTSIDRIVPMLRALRHGDGRLALFNGSVVCDRETIDSLFAQAKIRGRPLSSAPHSGFHRLSAGKTLLIVDAGAPPAAGADLDAHSGTLSFEMSVGKHRLIVNCGVHSEGGREWGPAMRATAAHSTLVLGDVNSSEVIASGG